MDCDNLLLLEPYGLPRAEKRELFTQVLTDLTRRHRADCPEYARLLGALGTPENRPLAPEEVPMLPVSLFKELELRSVPEEAVFKTLTSSGTTGQKVSKIYLDAPTSALQQQVLCRIMEDVLGPKRMPLLVLDTRKVLRDRSMFSARGAGILGFSIFGSKICYALDEHMQLD